MTRPGSWWTGKCLRALVMSWSLCLMLVLGRHAPTLAGEVVFAAFAAFFLFAFAMTAHSAAVEVQAQLKQERRERAAGSR